MRTSCIESLARYAAAHPDVMLLTADLGYSVLERFADALPAQYANVGVCEQAMAGIAAGLALSGRRVVLYSIANFPTLRCLEQIRNDVCYHRLPVTVISVGGGLAYGTQGYTHHGIEDLGIMSMLPHMTVVCPADPLEASQLLPQLLERRSPCYIRLGKSGEPVLHASGETVTLGRASWLRRGQDVALLSTGPITGLAITAAEELAHQGISASVASLHTIKPLDEACILEAGRTHRAVLTVEEHARSGGLGSRVAETLLMAGAGPRFGMYGIGPEMIGRIGSQSYLLGQQGSIAAAARALLEPH